MGCCKRRVSREPMVLPTGRFTRTPIEKKLLVFIRSRADIAYFDRKEAVGLYPISGGARLKALHTQIDSHFSPRWVVGGRFCVQAITGVVKECIRFVKRWCETNDNQLIRSVYRSWFTLEFNENRFGWVSPHGRVQDRLHKTFRPKRKTQVN